MTNVNRIAAAVLAATLTSGIALAPAAQAAEDGMMKAGMHKTKKKHKGMMKGDAMKGDAMKGDDSVK